MKKGRIFFGSLMALLLLAVLCISLPTKAQAATVDDLTYEITNGEVTITDCDENASGELIIPDTIEGYPVTSIKAYAFFFCNKLNSVKIPISVSDIGSCAFGSCSNLTSIEVKQNNAYYSSDNRGVLFDKKKTTLIQAPSGISGEYVIPNSVTRIEERAFYSCDNLTSIRVDKNNAYYSSDNRGVLFDKKKTTLIQAPGAISGQYIIPDSVTSIGNYAFALCSNLVSVTIPDSVINIGTDAFADCDSMTSVTIPNSVTNIAFRAFAACSDLTGIWVEENNAYYSSDENGLLFNKEQTTLIQAPCALPDSYSIPYSVTSIGAFAFYNCFKLDSVTIPNSVTKIGDRAFVACYDLDDVYYSGTQKQWKQINIESNNDSLLNATLHPNQVSFGITKQPANKNAFIGQKAKFTVKAIGKNLKYQWQYRTSSAGAWKNASGTGSKTASISIAATAARNGYQYRCQVTDKYGNTVYSNAATLKIMNLKVTTQPANKYLPAGKTAKFTVKASGAGLKYQWQYRTSAKGSWKAASGTGSKKATLSVAATAARNGYQYRCKITDKYGNVIYSKAATLKIVTLKITTQPASVKLKAGKTATFKTVAKGTGLKYQWQYRKNAKGAWKKATGTGNKTATFKVPVTAAKNGYQYRCVITDKYGNVINSKAATLNVTGGSSYPKASVTDAYLRLEGNCCYHIPKINLPGNAAAEVNKKIYDKFYEKVDRFVDAFGVEFALSYTWFQYKDVVSVVVRTYLPSSQDCYAYTVSATTGKELSNAQVAQRLGLSEAQCKKLALTATDNYFQKRDYGGMSYMVEELKAETKSISSNWSYIITNKGELCFVGLIATGAGRGYQGYIIHKDGTADTPYCQKH